MADDFDAAGISWWSTARTGPSSSTTTTSFDGSSAITAAASTVSCSAAIADPGCIDQQSASGALIDSSLQISSYGMDWNQSLLRSSSTTVRAEPSVHAMLQESFNYPSLDSGHHQQPHHHIGSEQFLVDHQQQQVQQQPALSMMLQGLFEQPEAKPQQPIFNYQYPSSVAMSSHFLTSPSTKQQQQQQQQQLQFSNNAAFWNASAGPVSDARPGFFPLPLPVQFSTAIAQSYDHKPSCSSLTASKSNSDTVQKKSTGGSGSGSSEPALKKSRIEAPSPLPTFKVRKEKLGDRITALQQLVSPFGKTDTASVLHEAIEYIKFLHDQVSMLSTPYLKSGHPMQQQQQQGSDKSKDGEGARQDLISRGLCLVPIESTYPVVSETTADFWTPTFGGTYR